MVPYLKRFILDAFLDVLYLKFFLIFRYEEIIEYFLENGINLQKDPLDECIMTITRIAKYIADDPPVEIL